MLAIVRFENTACGCLVGRYRNTVTGREVVCVEASSARCGRHRRDELVDPAVPAPVEARAAAC
jgi:hypothetical protein